MVVLVVGVVVVVTVVSNVVVVAVDVSVEPGPACHIRVSMGTMARIQSQLAICQHSPHAAHPAHIFVHSHLIFHICGWDVHQFWHTVLRVVGAAVVVGLVVASGSACHICVSMMRTMTRIQSQIAIFQHSPHAGHPAHRDVHSHFIFHICGCDRQKLWHTVLRVVGAAVVASGSACRVRVSVVTTAMI